VPVLRYRSSGDSVVRGAAVKAERPQVKRRMYVRAPLLVEPGRRNVRTSEDALCGGRVRHDAVREEG
jgi:hypothetical protein